MSAGMKDIVTPECAPSRGLPCGYGSARFSASLADRLRFERIFFGRIPGLSGASPYRTPSSIHIPLIPMLGFEPFHICIRLFLGLLAGLFDDRMQRRVDIFRHSLGVATHVEMGAFLKPGP